MSHYKDKNDNVHFIEDDKHKDLLPKGCVKISDDAAILLKKTKDEETDKADKLKVDPLWDAFDSATTVPALKTAIKKIFGR